MKSKLMSEGFLVLHLIKRGRLLKLAAQIGELVVAPYLLQAKLFALRLVPGVVKVQCAGILAAVRLPLSSASAFSVGGLRGLGRRRLLLHLVQLGGGDEDGQLGQPVFCGLVAGNDEDFGIEVGICVAGNFPQLQGVFVAVVGDDVNVGRACSPPSA